MKTLLIANFFLLGFFTSHAQDAKQLYANARTLMQQGDYDNATLAMNKALEKEPANLEMLKDFAFLNYLKRDFAGSIQTGKIIIERPDADEQAFQILGMDYKAIADFTEASKLYKRGLKKFPNSGVLYNESAELLAMQHDLPGAIIEWEKGISVAPNYSSNYYNAAMYYARTSDIFWAVVYGEVFVNLESYSARTAEIKSVLLEAYRKLYTEGTIANHIAAQKSATFEKAFLETLNKSKSMAADGITADNLTAMRTRFILDWYSAGNNEKFAFRLFDNLQYLLREGMFNAYNEWLFGTAASPAKYQVWVDTHDKEAKAFKDFQEGRVFKMVAGQIYKS